jgi:hypothetical protein
MPAAQRVTVLPHLAPPGTIRMTVSHGSQFSLLACIGIVHLCSQPANVDDWFSWEWFQKIQQKLNSQAEILKSALDLSREEGRIEEKAYVMEQEDEFIDQPCQFVLGAK